MRNSLGNEAYGCLPMAAMAIVVVAIGLALAACKPGASITCTPLKQYSADFMKAAAKEYAMVEVQAPHLVRLVDDYGIERDAIRACLKRRK